MIINSKLIEHIPEFHKLLGDVRNLQIIGKVHDTHVKRVAYASRRKVFLMNG